MSFEICHTWFSLTREYDLKREQDGEDDILRDIWNMEDILKEIQLSELYFFFCIMSHAIASSFR